MLARGQSTPAGVCNSLKAEITAGVVAGEISARQARLLRQVLVPFVAIFTEHQLRRDRETAIESTLMAAGAILSHMMLNGRPVGCSAEDVLDPMLAIIRRRVLASLSVGGVQ